MGGDMGGQSLQVSMIQGYEVSCGDLIPLLYINHSSQSSRQRIF